MSYSISSEEAKGRTPLPAEGPYDNCEITNLDVFPPSERYPKPGVKAVLRFRFENDTFDGVLEKRMNLKTPLSRKSTLWKMFNALFGEEGMEGKTAEDCVGKRVNVYISHEWTDGADAIKYADFKFSPVTE